MKLIRQSDIVALRGKSSSDRRNLIWRASSKDWLIGVIGTIPLCLGFLLPAIAGFIPFIRQSDNEPLYKIVIALAATTLSWFPTIVFLYNPRLKQLLDGNTAEQDAAANP
jgi:hypothetical protein